MNIWEKTKRNHGLEHGTISLIMSRLPHYQAMAGYSIPTGFFVVGDVTTNQVESCSTEALSRMQAGETDLAVSPFCGTNIVVGAGMATFAILAGYATAGRGLAGLNRAFSNAALAIMASQPLGRFVQKRYTTSGDVSNMRIESIKRHQVANLNVHWVATEFS